VRRKRAAGIVVSVALGVGLSFAPPATVSDAAAGDAKVADSLFKSGKQALGKGDAAGAVSFFKKAQVENPDLIEACWWRASAQEKAGDKSTALASYREYLQLFDGKAAGAPTSKEEQRLKGLADKSVDALAAGEKEFKKLEDGYVTALLAFAKESFVRDPGLALKAVQAVLVVRPDHEEAQKLREKLGGAPAAGAETKASDKGPGPATGPFASVKEWKDFFAMKSFRSNAITYSGEHMVVDAKAGIGVNPGDFVDLGKSYAFEMEFRLAEAYDRNWICGLSFGWKDGDFMCGFVSPARVVLAKWQGGQAHDLGKLETSSIDAAAWHRLGIVVQRSAVEVWLDGKKAVSWSEPMGQDFPGELAISQQSCKTEWRLLRAGKLE
jgi:hypothetical protein